MIGKKYRLIVSTMFTVLPSTRRHHNSPGKTGCRCSGQVNRQLNLYLLSPKLIITINITWPNN